MDADLFIEHQMEEVAHARHRLMEHASTKGLQDKKGGKIGLVVSKACTNIIKHAYSSQPNYPIELSLSIDRAKLVLTIHDSGAKKLDFETF
jgi:anti-sigma regulatory factor (Ser/Thr protein kinase)